MPNTNETQLRQNLTLFGLTMIAIGASIGSGIFKAPSKIADALHDPTWILAIWVVGGIIAITGALSFAELGGMYPKAGGIYVYLREAFGKPVAFLYGWANLLVMNTGSIAGISLLFSTYFAVIFPESNGVFVACVVVVLVTIINIFGVKIGEIFANVFTLLKILGIAAIVLLGLFFVTQNTETLNQNDVLAHTRPNDVGAAFATALIGVLWSYGGWQHISYLSGEAKNPVRDIPRAMILGAISVTVIYLLINIAYLRLLPVSELASSPAVAANAVKKIIPSGEKWIAVLIMISVFGTAGIYTLSMPRVYFAMANDGVFFKEMTYLHPRFRTPIVAIVVQSLWAIVLIIFFSQFEKIVTYVEFMDWVFLFLTGLTVFVLRYKKPTEERPIRALLYPITPFIFCAISAWFLFMTLKGEDSSEQAVAGLAVVALGLPLYFYFDKIIRNY